MEFFPRNRGGYSLEFLETFEDNAFLNHDWTIENPDNNGTWELTEVGGNEPGTIAAMVNFREIFAIGQTDNMISPPLDLTGLTEAYLYFDHAYAKYHEDATDSLIIYISADCGENWTRIFSAFNSDNSASRAGANELIVVSVSMFQFRSTQ